MIKLLLLIILPSLLSGGIAVTAQQQQQQQPTTTNNNINNSNNNNDNNNNIIFQKTINIDNQWQANVIIHEHEEPVDVIYNSLRPYGVDFVARRQVFEEVKSLGIPNTKEYAQLFSQQIVLDDDDSFSNTFTYYDNGSEPIDAIYNFAKQHSIESYFPQLTDTLLPQLCELVNCNRNRPRIWSNEILSDENDGQPLGMLEILQGDEPVDAVDAFVHSIAVDVGDREVFRQNILQVICKSIECTRSTPVVFRKLIKDETGKDNGSIEIYEGEEVIDAVVRFIRKSKMSLDEISLKNYMLQEACKTGYRVKCTRNVGVVYSQTVKDEHGSPIPNKLTIFENEEPADKVYQWCQENDVVYGFPGIIESVCESSDLVVCNRRKAAYFSIPIRGPEGEFVNTLELKVGNEPVDDIHSFFASNKLFKKGWDFQGLASQICAKPNVDCRRLRAVKHFDANFTMGDVNMGQLVIWQDEEVVDVLYNLRQSYNLTLEDQIASHNEICAKEDVNCDRTRAVIFQKTGSELLCVV